MLSASLNKTFPSFLLTHTQSVLLGTLNDLAISNFHLCPFSTSIIAMCFCSIVFGCKHLMLRFPVADPSILSLPGPSLDCSVSLAITCSNLDIPPLLVQVWQCVQPLHDQANEILLYILYTSICSILNIWS